jgi:predicted transcriptional regulator
MSDEELSGLLASLSGVLGIRNTGREILELLIRTKKKFTVAEIISRLKRSERSIRGHLSSLSRMELVRKEPTITERGKRVHRYFATRLSDLVQAVRREASRRLRKLEKHAKNRRGAPR